MNRFLVILIVITLPLILLARDNKYIFQNLGSKDGITYSAVRDIVQDKKGYIWIATLKGLNRYDGYDIKQYYKSEDGLPSNCIEKILPLDNNSLLLGTDEGLCIYDMLTEEFINITSPDKESLNIIDLLDNGQTIFLASEKGLYTYNHENRNITQLFDGEIMKLTQDINGNVWTFSREKVYCFHATGQLIKEFDKSDISPTYPVEFSAIYCDSQGTLWLGTTEDGIYRYSKNKNEFLPLELLKQDRKNIRYVRCICEDMRGNLWIGTENGLFIYNYTDNSYAQYKEKRSTSQTGPNDNAIYSIYKSREDIMWIGTFFGGVNYVNLSSSDFGYILADNGISSLNGKAVSNIMEDSRGALWMTSEDKGISIFYPDDRIEYLNKSSSPSLNGDNVHALTEDPQGNVWIGNFVDGLHKINPITKRLVSYKNTTRDSTGLSNNSIYKLLIHNSDSMFIGTNLGIDVYHFKKDIFTRFRPDIFDHIRIDDMIHDTRGNLWFSAHFDGIFFYDVKNDKIRHYKRGTKGCDEIISDNIYSSCVDTQGSLWFGTSNGGLMLYNEGKDCFVVYGKEKDLHQRDIYAILEDAFGYLWLSTDNGIFCFNPTDKTFTQYKASNEFISNQFNIRSLHSCFQTEADNIQLPRNTRYLYNYI